MDSNDRTNQTENQLQVILVDPSGNKSDLVVPANAEVRKLLAAIIQEMRFPYFFENGVRVEYYLALHSEQLILDPIKRLSDFQILEHSEIYLHISNLEENITDNRRDTYWMCVKEPNGKQVIRTFESKNDTN